MCKQVQVWASRDYPMRLILIWDFQGTQNSLLSYHLCCFWVRMTPEAKGTLYWASLKFLFLSTNTPPSLIICYSITKLMANREQTHLWICCCSKHFPSIDSLNPQNNAIRWVLLLSPSYKQGTWGLDRFSHLSKVTQPVSRKTGVQT